MELARYVVDAVVLERRSCRDVARAHGVSKSWVAELVARYRAGGYDAVAPRSKAAHKVANRSSDELEDRVVRIRKELTDDGLRRGAADDPLPPRAHRSVAAVGVDDLADPQTPGLRHAAAAQAAQELLHPLRGERCPTRCGSRTSPSSSSPTAPRSRSELHRRLLEGLRGVQGVRHDDRARCRRDPLRGRRGLGSAGIAADRQRRHLHRRLPSRLLGGGVGAVPARHRLQALTPLSPTDLRQGRALPPDLEEVPRKTAPADTIAELQAQSIASSPTTTRCRPHRAKGRKTPRSAFDSRDKARPIKRTGNLHERATGPPRRVDSHGVGDDPLQGQAPPHRHGQSSQGDPRRSCWWPAVDVRIITTDGELLRELRARPERGTIQTARTRVTGVHYAPRHPSTMPRDITRVGMGGLEPPASASRTQRAAKLRHIPKGGHPTVGTDSPPAALSASGRDVLPLFTSSS